MLFKLENSSITGAHAGFMIALVAFFILAFSWSWSLGFIALNFKTSAPLVGTILSIASGFGPHVSAIVTIAF